jgi:hypothetical protein
VIEAVLEIVTNHAVEIGGTEVDPEVLLEEIEIGVDPGIGEGVGVGRDYMLAMIPIVGQQEGSARSHPQEGDQGEDRSHHYREEEVGEGILGIGGIGARRESLIGARRGGRRVHPW